MTAGPANPAPDDCGPRALLVCGILAADIALLDEAEAALGREFGPVTDRSADIPFDFTDYYEAEFGPGLVRRWVGFSPPCAAVLLAAAKLATGAIEQAFAVAGRRRVNLDPGLLTLHNLVLATTKDFAHRIYLRDGIRAELTLLYADGGWVPLPWTYPDYRTEACHQLLTRCRAHLLDPPTSPSRN
ncbi:MAG: DUF4416 family protein [bacterium]